MKTRFSDEVYSVGFGEEKLRHIQNTYKVEFRVQSLRQTLLKEREAEEQLQYQRQMTLKLMYKQSYEQTITRRLKIGSSYMHQGNSSQNSIKREKRKEGEITTEKKELNDRKNEEKDKKKIDSPGRKKQEETVANRETISEIGKNRDERIKVNAEAQTDQEEKQEELLRKRIQKELEEKVRKISEIEKEKEALKVEMGKLRSLGGDRQRRDLESVVHRSAQFFCGDVLDGMEDEKEFLTSLIEEEFRGILRRTRLLYRLDKRFPRNPHPLIDGVSPFVLLVRTASGQLVAGVSEGALVPQGNQGKRGWLVSLNRQRVWWAREDKQAVTHDNTFIIFGNQELRVAGNSTGVYSNFGAGNSFYRTNEGTNDVTDFIGPTLPNNPREALLDTFEIFQLFFE